MKYLFNPSHNLAIILATFAGMAGTGKVTLGEFIAIIIVSGLVNMIVYPIVKYILNNI